VYRRHPALIGDRFLRRRASRRGGDHRQRWVILVVVLIACILLWTQMINVMCDQDVQFFSGICSINKFIPW
jgi:hypothetical protein